MLILGLVLIALGALAIIVVLLDGTGNVEVIGIDTSAVAVFVLGVIAGAAVLWGFTLMKYGAKRSLRHRRERAELTELSQKLDRVESERRDRDGGGTAHQ